MQSIVMQQYSNYHIVVIDDMSTDGTGQLIDTYLATQNKISQSNYLVIHNKVQMFALANIRTAAEKFCKPEQLFLIVDGDDQLLGRQVLKVFNAVFQEKKLWFVYSNYLHSNGDVGYSRPFPKSIIKANNYRKYKFFTNHLRVYYTKLLLNIKDSDFRDEKGELVRAANDVAICIPILEQSHERTGYLPQITYFYNANTTLNNHLIRSNEQLSNDKMIRKKPRYIRLKSLF